MGIPFQRGRLSARVVHVGRNTKGLIGDETRVAPLVPPVRDSRVSTTASRPIEAYLGPCSQPWVEKDHWESPKLKVASRLEVPAIR